MGEKADRVGDVMNSIYVSDIIQGQKLLFLSEGDSVSDAAKVLTTNHISSVPVFKTKESQKLSECLGIVDFYDIVTVLIELRNKGFAENDPRKNIWMKISNMSVKDAIKFNAAKYVQVDVKSPVVEAVKKCADFSFRRMLAVDEDDSVVGVVSPSEMLKQILEGVGEGKESILSKSIGDLKVGTAPVISVARNETLEKAFTKMVDEMVAAVAVVDPTSAQISASLSASDVGSIIEEQNSGFLKASVWKYFTFKKEKEVNESFPYFNVSTKASLRLTIDKLQATQVHHLYVVDEQSKPLKIVGFADICRGLLS